MATAADIPEMHAIRLRVRENELMRAADFARRPVLRPTTAPATRAANFHLGAGYTEIGPTTNGKELIFELLRH